MSETLTKVPVHPLFETVLLEDLEYRPEDAAELYRGKAFTGIAYDYDEKTGALVDETSYWNGGLHGFVKQWYPNGQVKLECRYFHGAMYGDLKAWYENGQLKRHGVYWSSQYPIREKKWDEVGNVTEDYYVQNDESKYGRYIKLKRNYKETLPLRANWASASKSPGLIDFNKRIQLYLREHPFVGIEPKKPVQ